MLSGLSASDANAARRLLSKIIDARGDHPIKRHIEPNVTWMHLAVLARPVLAGPMTDDKQAS